MSQMSLLGTEQVDCCNGNVVGILQTSISQMNQCHTTMLHNAHFWSQSQYQMIKSHSTPFTHAVIHKNIGRVHLSTSLHLMPKHKFRKHIILSSECVLERTKSCRCDAMLDKMAKQLQPFVREIYFLCKLKSILIQKKRISNYYRFNGIICDIQNDILYV